MSVVYQAEFHESSFTRTMPDNSRDTCPINEEEISQLEKTCRDFTWNQSLNVSREIGKKLFDLLDGDRQTLIRALNEAEVCNEKLQVILKGEGSAAALPFELLYHDNYNFLVPSQVHLIRRVSERGKKSKPIPQTRPLKLLLMACSPIDVSPVLEFEKEEDTIFEVTEKFQIEIDTEDSGSLEGLGEQLADNKYDIVHITGHADIDENGKPFFWMEDDEGLPVQVTPSQLWEKLDLNMPRLVFLSGCRTGQAPEHVAAMSFAHQLVKGHVSSVIGWGLPVSDKGASLAAKNFYFELSRGENILDAVLRTRHGLFEQYPDWSILRLFSDGTALDVSLVARSQKKKPKPRRLKYTFLENSDVKVLKKGFIGRRRQIQQAITCLIKDEEKVGLLLHGTGGLGKSCLAGKLCERLKDYRLIIVHGVLDTLSFSEALKHGFKRANDKEGLEILEEKEEMPDKIERLCYSAFQEKNYIILLDDFEKNIVNIEQGRPEVCYEAAPILESLLKFLPYTAKMTQMIITSRYTFPFTWGEEDLVQNKLKSIGLTTFQDADNRKKVSELNNIDSYPNPKIRQQLIEAGRGNPRLMEALDTLIEVKGKDLDIASLLLKVKNKHEEFVQELILNQILMVQPEQFQTFLRRCAVFWLPVTDQGIETVCTGIKDWKTHMKQAVRLSLMEKDTTRKEYRYWVTPLIQEDIFEELEQEQRKTCHKNAVSYYQSILSRDSEYIPTASAALIRHAVKADLMEIAAEEGGGKFLPYSRENLAYREALEYGNYILKNIPEIKRDEKSSRLLFELGYLYSDTGKSKKAIEYYEQALSIDKEVYGERHPNVATYLNNIGLAWKALGDAKKAMQYYEQAYDIFRDTLGDEHPHTRDVKQCLDDLNL